MTELTPESPRYKIIYHPYYSFESAQHGGTYVLYKLKRTIFGNYKYCLMTSYVGYPFDTTVSIGGDREWAKRTARELDIKLPKEYKESI